MVSEGAEKKFSKMYSDRKYKKNFKMKSEPF